MSPDKKELSNVIFAEAFVVIGLSFLAHTHVLSYLVTSESLLLPLWKIYLFLLIITFVLCYVLVRKLQRGNPQIINTFFGLTILKMVLSILFLVPLFVSEMENKQADTFNFFIAYFLFLAVELYVLNNLLKKTS